MHFFKQIKHVDEKISRLENFDLDLGKKDTRDTCQDGETHARPEVHFRTYILTNYFLAVVYINYVFTILHLEVQYEKAYMENSTYVDSLLKLDMQ